MKVAVAVIFDSEKRILITQRPLHAPHGGMWEFPGGKLEEQELPEAALIREIKEEVGIDVLEHHFLGEIVHYYAAKKVSLLIFSIDKYQGKPVCREAQMDLRWVAADSLKDYHFPEANIQIIELIKKDYRACSVLAE